MHERLARLAGVLAQLPLPEGPARSLSLGCGRYTEGGLLRAQYPRWVHLGVDLMREGLVPGDTVQADIRHLPFAPPFALILARHPDLLRRRTAWARAFAVEVPRLLAPKGLLLLSLYSLSERDSAYQQIGLAPYPLALAHLPPADSLGRDRYLLAFQHGDARAAPAAP